MNIIPTGFDQAVRKSHGLFFCLFAVVLCISGCRTPDTFVEGELPPEEQTLLEEFFQGSDIFNQSITGFALYDPETDSILYSKDAHRYYTPASNTKIFTLYAALKALPDTLPSLRYQLQNDTLYFRGTGDPAFLNPLFDNGESFDFLKNREEVLVYYDGHFDDRHFGSGWAWDWYPAPYAPEKAPFPMYGNMVRLQTQQVALIMLNEEEPVKPAFFKKYIEEQGWNSGQLALIDRDHRENRFLYAPKADTARQERNIPFVYSRDLILEMLSDTLGREVIYTTRKDLQYNSTLYATPADTLYKRLMLESDNFIAEQLLLMISDGEFNRMDAARAINFSVREYFADLPDAPRWSDGSGLTRYNLMTPRSIVVLLNNLYDEFGEDRILPMFPAGGKSGTLRGRYIPPEGEPPFVYAKTGTLRNNNALSGYIYTDSGKRLIFSFINNNFVVSSNAIINEMERALNLIKENY